MDLIDFICGFVNSKYSKNLKFLVIRNHEELPRKKTGNDIDIIVKPSNLQKWEFNIKLFCEKNNLDFEFIKSTHYCISTKVVGINDCHNNELYLDFNYEFNWRGVEFYPINDFVNSSISYNEFIYTSENQFSGWYITFCHSFLYGGFVNPKYIQNYIHQINTNHNDFRNEFLRIFTKKEIKFLFSSILDGNTISKTKANVIRVKLILRNIKKQPFKNTVKLIKTFFNG